MTGKVAVIGSSNFVMPYSAMGVDTYAVSDEKEVILAKAGEIIAGKYALVVVAENIAKVANEVFAAVNTEAVPAVIIVPFTTESTGIATDELSKALKMATGVDILKSS